MIKALVTGAGALLGQGIIRSLKGSTLDVHIITVDPHPLSAGLYWGDERYLIPLASAPDYPDAVSRLFQACKPDIVFVGTDVELMYFAENRAQLETAYNTCIVVSTPEVVAIADDKWLTYQFFREHGFDPPATSLPGGECALIDSVGFPLVVKPRVGARSVGVHLVHDRPTLAEVLTPESVIQEAVATSAEEYTAGTVTFDACLASIVMRRDLRDGNTYRAYAKPYPQLDKQVQAFANQLKAYGPANFQFRLNKDGCARVFEINARFSGTTPLRALAGFNEVEMVTRYILFGETIEQPAVKAITILRHWSETVVTPEQAGSVKPVRSS